MFFCSLKPPRTLRLIALWTLAYSGVTMIGYITFIITLCSPPPYFWNQFDVGSVGTCISAHRAYTSLHIFNIPNIIGDLTMAILPCAMVQGMNMSRGKKCITSVLLGISTW